MPQIKIFLIVLIMSILLINIGMVNASAPEQPPFIMVKKTIGNTTINNITNNIINNITNNNNFSTFIYNGTNITNNNNFSTFIYNGTNITNNIINNITNNNNFTIYLGNSTQEIINAVNETALNGTNFFNILWSNIANKFITAVDNVYLYMSGTTATLNESKLNSTILALEVDTYNTTLQMQKALKPNITHLDNIKLNNISCSAGFVLQNATTGGGDCINISVQPTTAPIQPQIQSWHICEFGLKEDFSGAWHDYNLMFTHGTYNCPFIDGYIYTICVPEYTYDPVTWDEAYARMYFDVSSTDKSCEQGGGIIWGNVWHPKNSVSSPSQLTAGNFTYGVRMRLANNLTWSGALNNVTMFVNDGENNSKRAQQLITLTDQWQWFYLNVQPVSWSNSRRWGVRVLYGQDLCPDPFCVESFQIEWEQAVIIQ